LPFASKPKWSIRPSTLGKGIDWTSSSGSAAPPMAAIVNTKRIVAAASGNLVTIDLLALA
jgi:hypothetical protein